MSPLRILHIYSGNLMGGIERHLITLSEYVPRFGTEIKLEFALCFAGSLSRALEKRDQSVHVLGNTFWRNPASVHRARLALEKQLASERYDGVVIHAPWPLSLFWKTIEKSGTPYILHLHNELNHNHRLLRFYPDWQLWLSRRAQPAGITCASHFIENSINPWFPQIPRGTIYSPYSPECPTDKTKSRLTIRGQLSTPLDSTVFIHVGRMEPWKGADRFVRALAALPRIPHWEAWIVGGAQRPHEIAFEKRVKSLIVELGLASQIKLLGWREDVPHLLAAADAFCHTNRTPEPFGLVFIEALAAGLPIVAFDEGGASEIITRQTGALIPPDNMPEFVRALTDYLQSGPTGNTSLTAGPSRARNLCDPETQVNVLINFWRTSFTSEDSSVPFDRKSFSR